LPVFAFHIYPQFHEPQFTSDDILQELSVKLLRVTRLQNGFRLLAPECGAGFVKGNSGGDRLGGSVQGAVLKSGRVRLLRVELHQSGRVPVAHLAALGAEVAQDFFRRRRGLVGGASLAQPPQPRQPGLAAL